MNIILSYIDPAGRGDFFRQILPYGLSSISSLLLSKGFNCRVANLSSLDEVSIKKFIAQASPKIFGISVFTHNRKASEKLARIVKKISPDSFIVCGGPHATFCPDEILSWGVDGVVIGEGEMTTLELAINLGDKNRSELSDIQGLMVHRRTFEPRKLIDNLDDLPFAHKGLLNAYNVDVHAQSRFLITSRGCPASCSFCSSPSFWGGKLRFRSSESVLSEMIAIRNDLGLINLDIRDDTFTSDRKRALKICRGIIEHKLYFIWSCQSRVNYVDFELLKEMKLAGCESIQFGIESGSQKIRDILKKSISDDQIIKACYAVKKVGMNLSIYLMAGITGESLNDIELTADLIKSIKPHDGQVSPLAYFPGTELYTEWVTSSGSSMLSSEKQAYYADKELADENSAYIIKVLNKAGRKNRYSEADFITHQKTTGYCFAGNMMSAGNKAEKGDFDGAFKEYKEITVKEPLNPWGWLSLAELKLEAGNLKSAENYLLKTLSLVPANIEVIKELIQLYFVTEKYNKVKRYIDELKKICTDLDVVEWYDEELKKLKKGFIM